MNQLEPLSHILSHSLTHSISDTAGLIPLLYLTYLLMEYIEHRAGGRLEERLRRAGRLGPLFGGLIGAIPQCGLSASGASLYGGRVISAGTVVALFLSASDEMLPILISSGASFGTMAGLLAFKAGAGVVFGFAADALFGRRVSSEAISELCRRQSCGCGGGIFLSALVHTVKTSLFIFIVTFGLHAAIELLGEDALASLASSAPVVGELVCAAIGLIPNCAVSVVLTQLWLDGLINAGSMLSGLLACSGVGILVLFRSNSSLEDSLRIAGFVYAAAVVCGVAVNMPGATF